MIVLPLTCGTQSLENPITFSVLGDVIAANSMIPIG
jgi:hypothetical protein